MALKRRFCFYILYSLIFLLISPVFSFAGKELLHRGTYYISVTMDAKATNLDELTKSLNERIKTRLKQAKVPFSEIEKAKNPIPPENAEQLNLYVLLSLLSSTQDDPPCLVYCELRVNSKILHTREENNLPVSQVRSEALIWQKKGNYLINVRSSNIVDKINLELNELLDGFISDYMEVNNTGYKSDRITVIKQK